jgi:hypothetical protein
VNNVIFNIIFILPGYFSFLVVKSFKLGFGKKADVFDKTVYSLIFDIPIFLLTIKLINIPIINQLITKKDNIIVFSTITEFKEYFIDDINQLLQLVVVIAIISILVGLAWIFLLWIIGKVYNNFSKRKVFVYSTIWNKRFYEEKNSIPIQVYKGSIEEPIISGFLSEISASLDDDLEFEVFNTERFKQCKQEGLLEDIDYVYFNSSKDLKIIVYKLDGIKKRVEEGEKQKEEIENE